MHASRVRRTTILPHCLKGVGGAPSRAVAALGVLAEWVGAVESAITRATGPG